MERGHIAFLSALLAIVLSNTARAQESAGEKETIFRAEQYFARGEVLFEAGEYSKAAEAFMLAFETVPHPSALMNAALAYEQGGYLSEAIRVYEKYLVAAKERGEEDQEVQKYVESLKEKISELEISADCGAAKCLVSVDGIERGEAPVKVTVLPGEHNVEALKAGKVEYSKTVTVLTGEPLTVHLEPEKKVEEKPAPGMHDSEIPADGGLGEKRKMKLKAPFWVAAGVAVAAGAVSLGFEIGAAKDYNDFQDTEDIGEKEDLKSSGEDKMLVAGITVGVAACAAVVATVFAVRDFKRAKKEKAEQTVRFRWDGSTVGVSF